MQRLLLSRKGLRASLPRRSTCRPLGCRAASPLWPRMHARSVGSQQCAGRARSPRHPLRWPCVHTATRGPCRPIRRKRACSPPCHRSLPTERRMSRQRCIISFDSSSLEASSETARRTVRQTEKHVRSCKRKDSSNNRNYYRH